MCYIISQECINCGACVTVCPVQAISDGDGQQQINCDVCIECNACAEACPVGAPKLAK